MNSTIALNTPELPLQQHSLTVEGMTCASCVARVEKALKKLSGVQEATVNLATERATVQSIDGGVTPEQLIAAVQKIGYHAALSTDTVVNDDNVQSDSEWLKVLWGMALSLPLIAPMLLSVFGIHWMLSGSDMDDVAAVSNIRDACAVFQWQRNAWTAPRNLFPAMANSR